MAGYFHAKSICLVSAIPTAWYEGTIAEGRGFEALRRLTALLWGRARSLQANSLSKKRWRKSVEGALILTTLRGSEERAEHATKLPDEDSQGILIPIAELWRNFGEKRTKEAVETCMKMVVAELVVFGLGALMHNPSENKIMLAKQAYVNLKNYRFCLEKSAK